MFSNHFITNFPQNTPLKKILKIGQYLAKMNKSLWLTFLGHPVVLALNMIFINFIQGVQKLSDL